MFYEREDKGVRAFIKAECFRVIFCVDAIFDILCIVDTAYNFDRAVIDNEEYVLIDSVDRNGNIKTVIRNLTANTSDVVTTNADATEIYLNGKLVATVSEEPIDGFTRPGTHIQPNSFTYVGNTTKTISWIEGTAAGVVAAIIAAAIGNIGAATVIAKMGLAALAIIATQTTYGTVSTDVYKMGSSSIVTYKFVWTFTTSGGESFGSFSHIQQDRRKQL